MEVGVATWSPEATELNVTRMEKIGVVVDFISISKGFNAFQTHVRNRARERHRKDGAYSARVKTGKRAFYLQGRGTVWCLCNGAGAEGSRPAGHCRGHRLGPLQGAVGKDGYPPLFLPYQSPIRR